MSVSAEFLDQSEAALKAVVQEFRPRLLAASGNIENEMKSDNTPVTQLDLEVESAVRAALLAVDPAVGLEGEEHGIEGSRERFWLIDPIDGTEQFLRGIPAYRCMATLVSDDELQYTFVYDFASGDTYTARKDGGSYRNGKPVKLSRRPFERALIEFTANLALPETLQLIPVIRQQTRGVRMSGYFTNTLEGKFEGHLYYKASGSTWDWTPWALLIKEAGGKVANFGSDSYDYKNPNFLAATPAVFDSLKPIIDEALAA